ncbi:hypothetical protein BH09PSE1_BH09PSE1_23370 [soil metagenome]
MTGNINDRRAGTQRSEVNNNPAILNGEVTP